MKTLFFILVSTFFLISCGGGSQTPNTGGNNNPELIFEFDAPPLHAKIFNISAPSGTDNHFHPGDNITIFWHKKLYFSDGSSRGLLDQYLYDSSVYLSNNANLEETTDLKLFTAVCSIPSSTTYECSEWGNFTCLYAENNQNTISCQTTAHNTGVTVTTVDTSTFIDMLPKDVHIIIKSCLREDPSNCTEANSPLKLL